MKAKLKKILEKLSSEEIEFIENYIKENCNSGHHNSGHYNSGHYNSGHHNSGHYNSGDHDSGNYNSGDHNSGHRNSGHHNSGDWNSGYQNSGHHNNGHRNSGNYNSGHRNSGNYNSGDHNSGNYNSASNCSGFFNSTEPTIRMFNKDTGLTKEQICIPHNIDLKLTEWIPEERMTKKQKTDNPGYICCGGFLLTRTYKEAWLHYWKNLNVEEKNKFFKLPNFDRQVFAEITGIEVTELEITLYK